MDVSLSKALSPRRMTGDEVLEEIYAEWFYSMEFSPDYMMD